MHQLDEILKKLGLNETKRKAYAYILKNKKVNPTMIAKMYDITLSRATRLLQELKEEGFIKSYFAGRQHYYLPNDISLVKKALLLEKKQEVMNMEEALDELESGFGEYDIKVMRIDSENLVETVREEMKDEDKLYEFIDYKNMINKKVSKITTSKELYLVYDNDEFDLGFGKKVELDKHKKYAHVLVFGDKVQFAVSNKETILVDNNEIANVIKYLIIEKAT